MFLIVISLIISFMNAFISYISAAVLSIFKYKIDTNDKRNEIADIKKQLSQISIVDEFAKYARLERKLNKLNDDMKKEVRDNLYKQVKLNATVTYLIQAVIIIVSVVVFWTYRWTPVAVLPPEWLSPFSSAVSWPTGQPGAVGFPVWFLACNTFAKLVATQFV